MKCRQEVISLRYDPGLEVPDTTYECFIMSENDGHAGFGSGWFFYVFDSGIIYPGTFSELLPLLCHAAMAAASKSYFF